MNSVNLVGRLTRDPEIKKTQTGKSVLSFNLAVNRKYAKDGQQEADFVSCVAWDKTADFIGNYLSKASLISVEGQIQSRNYDDQNGKKIFVQEVYAESVQALESKAARYSRGKESYNQPRQQNSYQQPKNDGYSRGYEESSFSMDDEPVLDITSDDLPF